MEHRLKAHPEMMIRRRSIVEHLFGNLKQWLFGNGRGCVKTFSSRFDGLSRNKNRVPTQISDLLTNQVQTDFK
jgi:hypothetical protein